MQINKTAQTSFQGGFRLMNLSTEARTQLPNVVKQRRQIFDSINKRGDVFITVRDEADYKIAKFIKEHNIDFELYPSISTKSGLDTERPWEVEELIASLKEKPITTMTQVNKHLVNQKRLKYIKAVSQNYTDKILGAIRVSNKDCIENVKGVTIVTDNELQRKVYISPPSEFNIHYVRVQPKSIDKIVERYAIDSEGNILARYQTPDAILEFNKRFNKLVIK